MVRTSELVSTGSWVNVRVLRIEISCSIWGKDFLSRWVSSMFSRRSFCSILLDITCGRPYAILFNSYTRFIRQLLCTVMHCWSTNCVAREVNATIYSIHHMLTFKSVFKSTNNIHYLNFWSNILLNYLFYIDNLFVECFHLICTNASYVFFFFVFSWWIEASLMLNISEKKICSPFSTDHINTLIFVFGYFVNYTEVGARRA